MANKLRSKLPASELDARPAPEVKEPAPKAREKAAKPAAVKSGEKPLWLERAQKITGLFLLLTSLYLFTAFSSFLFTWEQDQSVVAGKSLDIIFDADHNRVDNWLGIIGAFVSHLFMHRWFGVASFLFVLVSFLTGYRLLFKVSLMAMSKTIAYALFLLVYISVSIGFILSAAKGNHYYLAGAYGVQINLWLNLILGKIGTFGALVFAGLSCLVIAYNLEFKLPARRKKAEVLPFLEEDELLPVEANRKPEIPKTSEFNAKPKPFETRNTSAALSDEQMPVMLSNEIAKEEVIITTIEEDHSDVPADELAENFQSKAVQEEENDGFEIVQAPVAAAPAAEANLELDVVAPEEEETVLAQTSTGEITAADLVKELGEYDPTLDLSSYKYPTLDLLENYGSGKIAVNTEELERNKNRIVETLGHYNIDIAKIKATIGPTVTLYEIVPAAGVRISKIKNLEDDIALSLSALGIRIIAPIPGKGTIGIEVPNQTPEMVSMRSVMASEKYQHAEMDLPIALGKTISNEVFVADLAKMPHLLMAGATGQGKSVGINTLLVSLLYKKHPSQIKFVMVDPKKVELTLFRKIERHFLAKLPGDGDAIITDTKKVIHTLNSLCIEMDQRYELLKEAHVRNLKEYNAKFIGRRLNPQEGHRYLPFIVLVIDEFADLMMTAGKEIETPIARLAQLARAIGIHLVIATQRPSVNVITGTIKANFPARLAFRVSSKIDSRTILDAGGAEQLIGRGDMLLSLGSEIIRLQCAFVDTPEVEKITDFIGAQRAYPSAHLLPEYVDESGEGSSSKEMDVNERDALFEEAARLIVMHQQGSTSLVQRKLKLGYNRAGRIIDQLEAFGVVGPFEGSKAREVLIKDEYALEQHLNAILNPEN
jgi:S-DNA-T family DNA segregation ATPase FtsK/SpoIIIE